MSPLVPPSALVEHPTSNGKPMAENGWPLHATGRLPDAEPGERP